MESAVRVEGLRVEFPGRRNPFAPWRRPEPVVAVRDVSFAVADGEIFGIVGESGSGKSTTARCLVGAELPTTGEITIAGAPLPRRPDRAHRRRIQLVSQDPYSALNPALRVGDAVEEVLRVATGVSAADAAARTAELFVAVGLGTATLRAYPGRLSGGQRQRVNIVRALAAGPRVLVADEVVSALDASVQASVLALLLDLRDDLGISIVFISHNLAVVRQVCDRVAVMHDGVLVETGDVDEVFSSPRHPYTRELIAAVPRLRNPIERGI